MNKNHDPEPGKAGLFWGIREKVLFWLGWHGRSGVTPFGFLSI